MKLTVTNFLALVQPQFNYCSAVKGNCNKGHSQKRQKLQNRAARILIILPSNYDASIYELFKSLSWHKLGLQRKVDVDLSILMNKALNNETLEYLSLKSVNHMDLTPLLLKKDHKQTGGIASPY